MALRLRWAPRPRGAAAEAQQVLIEEDARAGLGGARGSGAEAAAARLVRGVPADQALGLRLLALARGAAAVHMAAVLGPAGPSGTQAAGLARLMGAERGGAGAAGAGNEP